MNVGIIGCGNIASMLHECMEGVTFLAVYDRHIERGQAVARKLGAAAAEDFEAFAAYPFDVVIEAASVEAVGSYARPLLEKGCDLVVLSSGALADPLLRNELEAAAQRTNATLHVPSGAIFGLDNAAIGRVGGLESIRMITVKPPRSLHTEVDTKTCLFRGSAFECIRHYPKNANAAVSLSMAAGIDADVELWADPQSTTIRHEIVMEGSFGSVTIAIDNHTSGRNPSTSYLAVLSVCALLRSLKQPVTIGS
jgi:aspartate dehydrogenase